MSTVSVKSGSPSRRELRQFGFILAMLSGLYGVFLLARGGWAGSVFLGVAGLIFTAFWGQWPGTRAFYSVWMRAAALLGQIMTALLLTALYLLLLTPIAGLARCFGQRFIDKGVDKAQESYWRPYRSADDRRHCEKQY